MKNILVFLMLFSAFSNASITPEVVLPANFDASKFTVRTIKDNTFIQYRQETDECNNVKFNDYFFLTLRKYTTPGYDNDRPEKKPVSEWFCLFNHNVYDVGYSSGVKEKVIFNKKNKSWKLIKNKRIISEHKNTPYIPLKLYNISSVNAKGFLVIDQNITRYDKSRFDDANLKKKFRFCMIGNEAALCGDGNLISNIDGKEIDFTPYLLKSLESMELSVKE